MSPILFRAESTLRADISNFSKTNSYEVNKESNKCATVGMIERDFQESGGKRKESIVTWTWKFILVGSGKDSIPARKRYDKIYIAKERLALWHVSMVVMLLPHVASAGTTRSIVLIPPENYTVFQNDTPAIFNCYGNGFGSGAAVTWTINGTGYDAVRHTQRGITVVIDPPTEATVSSRLSIPSNSTINNNTQVVCRTIDVTFINSLTSQPANLTIQGPLDAPINFYVNISNTSNTTFLLSWGAPFSLNVTNSADIISNYILCTNITIYGCRTIPSDPDCTFPRTCTSSVDFTNSSLNGTNGGQNKTTMDYGDPIQFTFSAVNGAGRGKPKSYLFQPKKQDTGFGASPVETTFISISISPTSSIASNTQSEVSSTVWIALGICCGFLIAGVLITTGLVIAIKHSSTRKQPGMDCCAEPSGNVELYSYATHHQKSTTDTNDQEKKLDGYIEVACTQVISIPAPPDEVHYSDVIAFHNQSKTEKSYYTDVACHPIISIPVPHQTVQYSEVNNRTACPHWVQSDSVQDGNECDPRWCHQPGSVEQVTTAHIAMGVDLVGTDIDVRKGKATQRILSEDFEQHQTHSSDQCAIKLFGSDYHSNEGMTYNLRSCIAIALFTLHFTELSPTVFVHKEIEECNNDNHILKDTCNKCNKSYPDNSNDVHDHCASDIAAALKEKGLLSILKGWKIKIVFITAAVKNNTLLSKAFSRFERSHSIQLLKSHHTGVLHKHWSHKKPCFQSHQDQFLNGKCRLYEKFAQFLLYVL